MWQLTSDPPEPDLRGRSWKPDGTSGIPREGYRDLYGEVHNMEMFVLVREEERCCSR